VLALRWNDAPDLTGAIQIYFGAERTLGWILLGLGVTACMAAIVLWRARRDPVRKGLLFPVLLLALGGAIGGPMLALRSTRQLETFPRQASEDPAGFRAEELARMGKVNANWLPLEITWVTLLGIGSAVAWRTRGVWRGVAIGVAGLAAFALVMDLDAQARARAYTEALQGP
jgi:hypothetical protein